MVWELDRLITAEDPAPPLYLDSPMAQGLRDLPRPPDYYDDETRQLLARRESPLDYPDRSY